MKPPGNEFKPKKFFLRSSIPQQVRSFQMGVIGTETRLVKSYKGSKRPEKYPIPFSGECSAPRSGKKLVAEEAAKLAGSGEGGASSSSTAKASKRKKKPEPANGSQTASGKP